MASFHSVLAVDIGGSKIAGARVNRAGRISDYIEIRTPAAGGLRVVEAVVQLLAQITRQGAGAIGADVPGLADPDGRVWAPNIRGWERMPLGAILRKKFRLPTLIESDRNAFVVGEAWKGAARNCRDVVFLAVGTGIGAGILAGGKLLRGHRELAGCAGWMAIRGQFLPIYGKMGCLESLAGGTGIGLAGSRRFGRKMTARDLTTLARQGNRNAKLLLEQAGRDLGLGLANLVDVLNPEVIVIGGGVAEAGNLLIGPARKTMKRWAQPLAARQVRVVRSALGAKASLLGVAKLAFDSCKR